MSSTATHQTGRNGWRDGKERKGEEVKLPKMQDTYLSSKEVNLVFNLPAAAVVLIGALAGLSGVWMEILCLVSVAFSVTALVLVVQPGK